MVTTMMISTAVLAAVVIGELVQLIMSLRVLFVLTRHNFGRETYNYDGSLSAGQGRRNDADGTWNRAGIHAYDAPGWPETAMRYDAHGPLVLQDKAMHFSRSLQEFAHDPDGNLLSDDRRSYKWNAENRLVAVGSTAGFLPAEKRQKLEMVYDHMGRRTIKKVHSWVNDAWQLDKTITFVYSGYNEIARFENGSLTKTYVWGEDLSGSLQGAGGVGGLLLVADGSNNYAPVYDANGNITAYVDAVTGNQVAEFSYSPFGRTITKSGSKADDFDYKFSTKPQDEETGLVYYIYRFYDSEMGRWMSRDKIGENGGVNVYGFVGNDGVGRWDYLGAVIKIKCNAQLRKYLKENKVGDWSYDGQHVFPGTDGFITGDADFGNGSSEILTTMIASKYVFSFGKLTKLKKHVDLRQRIVKTTESFQSNVPSCREAVSAVYRHNRAHLVGRKADLHIPGDIVYIYNVRDVSYRGSQHIGRLRKERGITGWGTFGEAQSGENLIYSGKDQYWGVEFNIGLTFLGIQVTDTVVSGKYMELGYWVSGINSWKGVFQNEENEEQVVHGAGIVSKAIGFPDNFLEEEAVPYGN